MNRLYEKIKGDVLALTERERAEPAQILLSSLDDDSQNSTSAAWDIELEARVKEILDGKIKGVPAEEVFAKIRRRYH